MRETQHIEFKSSFDDRVIETLTAFANTKGGRVLNKLIAEAFYLTGDIEKYGSGFLRIRDAISSYPTMKIDFKEIGGGFMVTIAYTKQKISTDIKDKDTNSDTNKLTEIQRIILREIENNENITILEISRIADINLRNTKNNISKLKEIGLLERIGNNKSGYWKVAKI